MALTAPERQALATIARASLAAAISSRPYTPANPSLPGLRERRGCFVTLKLNGELRGCLGCFVSDSPLYMAVSDYTRFSALDDPRFSGQRLTPAEVPNVAVDVSCLTPLEPCPRPERIILGTHGIYVRSGGRTGCFLPQVATETGWTVEEFWGHCCSDKAGLPWDAWQNPDVERMVFMADVFEA